MDDLAVHNGVVVLWRLTLVSWCGYLENAASAIYEFQLVQ